MRLEPELRLKLPRESLSQRRGDLSHRTEREERETDQSVCNIRLEEREDRVDREEADLIHALSIGNRNRCRGQS